nr:MAG TPA: hypothetical protein [Inoviridae sp.]
MNNEYACIVFSGVCYLVHFVCSGYLDFWKVGNYMIKVLCLLRVFCFILF